MANPPALTASDRAVLEFLAEHRIVRANHVERLLGVTAAAARRRLARLVDAGHVNDGRLYHEQPKHFSITRRGLAVIGSSLPAPRLDQMGYRHDVGLAWLWLAARDGAFGGLTEQISERQMRSADARAARGAEEGGDRFGVTSTGWGPNGGERLHYPDLLLRTTTGHTVAVELELSPKSAARLERIIGRYVADRRIDAVLYLVDDDRRAREITAAARRLGASKLIHVQRVQWSEQAGPPRSHGREAIRAHARSSRGPRRSAARTGEAER